MLVGGSLRCSCVDNGRPVFASRWVLSIRFPDTSALLTGERSSLQSGLAWRLSTPGFSHCKAVCLALHSSARRPLPRLGCLRGENGSPDWANVADFRPEENRTSATAPKMRLTITDTTSLVVGTLTRILSYKITRWYFFKCWALFLNLCLKSYP